MPWWKSFSERFGAPLLLLAMVNGFYWKLLSRQYTWMDQPDMAYQVLPWFQFQAAQWHKGKFPLWDPYLHAGQPLFGQLQPGAAYPFNWLLFLAPLKNGHIQYGSLNIYVILTRFLAALFCYWLCRDLGRSRSASILGGLAFGVSGIVGMLGWPQMLNGAIWTPLVLLFVFRVMRGYRPLASAAFGGLVLGFAFLSGHHQIPIFIGLMATGLWLAHLWSAKWEGLKAMAVFYVFAGLTGALQILPGIEAGKLSVRWVGALNDPLAWADKVPYEIHDKYSVLPLQVLGLVLPSVTDQEFFIGLGTLILVALGVAFFLTNTDVKRLLAVGAGALLFAMGSMSVFHGVSYLIVPMVEKARSPEMALVIVDCALAALAAFGVDALRSRTFDAGWVRWLCTAGSIALVAAVLMVSVRPETSREYERLVIFGFVAIALGLLIRGWPQLGDRSAVVALFIILAFEWGSFTGYDFRIVARPGGFLATLEQNGDIAAFIRGLPDFQRLEVNTDDVRFNFGDWEGIEQRSGYLANLTSNLGAVPIDAFAANYYMAKNPAGPGQVQVFQGRTGLRVFTNPGAAAFARATHATPCSGQDQVTLEGRSQARFMVKASMACAGTVVLAETFYPGWEAKIDGRSKAVHQVFGGMQGVDVDAGSHRVEFVYHPMSIYFGGALTALGLLGGLAIAIRLRSAR